MWRGFSDVPSWQRESTMYNTVSAPMLPTGQGNWSFPLSEHWWVPVGHIWSVVSSSRLTRTKKKGIPRHVQWVLKGAGAQEMKAEIEETVLSQLEEEKAEVEILLLSTKTCWKDRKITEPDSSQKCTVNGQDAIGRSCNTGNSDLV